MIDLLEQHFLDPRGLGERLLGSETRRIIVDGEHCAKQSSIAAIKWLRITDREDLAGIGSADTPARAANRRLIADRAGKGQRLYRVRFAIHREQAVGLGIVFGRHIEAGNAMQLGRGIVDESDPSCRIGDDDTLG